MAWWIFQNIVVTAALALVVAVVCRSARIGPVGRHALWVLVLVKFITPPLVVWPWAAPDPFGLARLEVRVEQPGVPAPIVQPGSIASDASEIGVPAAAATFARTESQDEPFSHLATAAWPWLLGIWAAGSVCLLGLEGVRLARLARRVRAARPAGADIVARVDALSARLGLRPVPVLQLPGSSSPVVWCLGRPRLLWPAALAKPGEPAAPADPAFSACIDGLLVHELAHVKRRDHLVGWIELVAGVFWWWNPLFWFVRSSLREQAELACDAWVISALPNGRRAYAESLLALSGAAARGPSPLSMAAVIGVRASSRRVLERRLVMIMQGRAPLRLSLVGLFSLALIGAATLPAWATGQLPPPPPPAPVVSQAVPPAPAPPARATTARRPRATAGQTSPTPPPPPPAPVPPARATTPTRARAAVGQASTPPPPPPAPPTPARARVGLPAPPPPPPRPTAQAAPVRGTYRYAFSQPELPADGQKLLQGFEADRAAIQQEADQKVDARRETLKKALENLQEQYTRAGKLDEAVAIRDYLRAGLPGLEAGWYNFVLRRPIVK